MPGEIDKWRMYAELSAAALVFFAAVLVGILAGLWLDGLLGTPPLLTLLLGFLGLAGAVANLLRSLARLGRHD